MSLRPRLSSLITLALLAPLAACGGSDPAADGTGTGPGAALKCASSGKNAWQTFGVDAFVAVNQAIFANVTDEVTMNGATNVGASFSKIGSGVTPSTRDDAVVFEGKLAAYLVYVYGGPNSITYIDGGKYSGVQDMVAAHVGLNITSAQYDYFITNIVVPALVKNGVTAADVTSCFAPPLVDANFKASIVGK